MENKLQQGDYVRNLTRKQFEELVLLNNQNSTTYDASIKESEGFISKSLMVLSGHLFHTEKTKAKTELSFSEFKQRLINTIRNAN